MGAEGIQQPSYSREALWKRKEELEKELAKIAYAMKITTDPVWTGKQMEIQKVASYEAELAQINEHLESQG